MLPIKFYGNMIGNTKNRMVDTFVAVLPLLPLIL